MAIKGVKSLNAKFKSLESVLASETVKNAVQRGAHTVQAEAQLLAPAVTGELRESIMVKVETTKKGVVGKVYTNKKYAPYVEFGTGSRGSSTYDGPLDITYKTEWAGQPAQPFLYPALKNKEKEVIEDIRNEIIEEIRKVATRGAK